MRAHGALGPHPGASVTTVGSIYTHPPILLITGQGTVHDDHRRSSPLSFTSSTLTPTLLFAMPEKTSARVEELIKELSLEVRRLRLSAIA
jgi:hypothetical protein